MANTYTQIYLHLIFATKNRDNAIPPTWEEKAFYIPAASALRAFLAGAYNLKPLRGCHLQPKA